MSYKQQNSEQVCALEPQPPPRAALHHRLCPGAPPAAARRSPAEPRGFLLVQPMKSSSGPTGSQLALARCLFQDIIRKITLPSLHGSWIPVSCVEMQIRLHEELMKLLSFWECIKSQPQCPLQNASEPEIYSSYREKVRSALLIWQGNTGWRQQVSVSDWTNEPEHLPPALPASISFFILSGNLHPPRHHGCSFLLW